MSSIFGCISPATVGVRIVCVVAIPVSLITSII